MNKKQARMIVESLPSLYPLMTADEEEAIWTLLAPDKNVGNNDDCISRKQAIDALAKALNPHLVKFVRAKNAIEQLPPIQLEIIRCKDCKHHWTHKCMDSMPIERCDLEQTFYDAEHDFCSLAERRADG